MLQGCVALATQEGRAAKSTLGCMRQAFAGYDLKARPDDEAHCIAAGSIARRCSVTEARIASYGKEFRDLFSRGDAQWRDIESDRRGIECARSATDEAAFLACCTK